MYSIYKITNRVNGKIYIGYTEKSIEERFKGHCADTRKPRPTRLLTRAIKKYGPDSFTIETLYEGTNKEYTLNDREQYYIDTYSNIVGWDNMYNIAPGGLGGDRSMSPAYQEYIKNRDLSGERNSFYGMSHTEETKRKISEANKGRLKGMPKSEETRRLMSINNPRYWQGKVAHNKGKSQRPLTTLQKAKQGNPVRYNGEVYPTLAEAARANDSTPYKVGRRCEYITLDNFIAEYKGQL
jgi:group I intron endonuclease